MKAKGVRLFLEPTLYGQELQIDYCLEYSQINYILASMYFTKSIKYVFLFISLFIVLFLLHMKS